MHIKDASFSSKFTATAGTARRGSWPKHNALLALLTLVLLILTMAYSGCDIRLHPQRWSVPQRAHPCRKYFRCVRGGG
jgi:hypothetical protein